MEASSVAPRALLAFWYALNKCDDDDDDIKTRSIQRVLTSTLNNNTLYL